MPLEDSFKGFLNYSNSELSSYKNTMKTQKRNRYYIKIVLVIIYIYST